MLTLYRRHRANCPHKSRRYKKCSCPIWAQGILRGKKVRQSLDLRNWEAANRRLNELEINGESKSVSVEEAITKFMADARARKLSKETLKKYKYVTEELQRTFGLNSVRTVTVLQRRAH